jgi:hypothetical protein
VKLALALLAAFLWQAGSLHVSDSAPTPQADPQHLRYERPLALPANASGIACAVLDASVYAHSASASADDLRVFRNAASGKQQEIPFVVSYSEAQPTDATTATIHNLSLRNGTLVFDLAMPPRAYTLVDLKLAAQNFIATADVSVSNGRSAPSKSLGTFTLFDLTQQHLARSTSLALQESTFAQLHIELHLHRIDGGRFPHLSTAIVQGATVPASREAQTLYTVVASTRSIIQQGSTSLAQLDAPAHVPIERVHFLLDAAYTSDFLRSVSIQAETDSHTPLQPQEVIDGEIWRVTRSANASGDPAIHAATLSLPAVIASNLHAPATIRIEVDNATDPLVPIKAIQLEMRQRTLCFDAATGSTYTLAYGDDALRPSVYDLSRLAALPTKPLVATLGLEGFNPEYLQRNIARTYKERNPEQRWVELLAALAVVGAFVTSQTKRRGRHR